MRVVIGAGPGGLRAAAALAGAGESVLLLQTAETVHGRRIPELPVDTGRLHVPPDRRAAVEAVMGPLVDAPDLCAGIFYRGSVHGLPLGIRSALRLFERQRTPHIYGRWLERQVRNAAIPLTGEGREERTYADWVTRRIGEPAMHHLLRSYATRRWGETADALSCTVAKMAHGMGDGRVGQVVGGGPDAALSYADGIIRNNGGEIRVGVKVQRLLAVDGRIVGVETDQGMVDVQGNLWAACPPAQIAAWLGDALPASLHRDAVGLRTADAIQVDMDGGPTNLPDVLHVLEGQASFYRIVQTYGGERRRVFHATRPSGTAADDVTLPGRFAAEAERMGLTGFRPTGARVERLVDHVPIWTPVVHPRLRRLTLAWRSLGLVAVGRKGVFAPIGLGAEVLLATRYARGMDPDQREAQRALIDPPVLSGSLRTHLSDLVIR